MDIGIVQMIFLFQGCVGVQRNDDGYSLQCTILFLYTSPLMVKGRLNSYGHLWSSVGRPSLFDVILSREFDIAGVCIEKHYKC